MSGDISLALVLILMALIILKLWYDEGIGP